MRFGFSFLKNLYRARHTFKSLYGKEPVLISADQMPLHRNESSNEPTLAWKGRHQTTFIKENHMLSRERITVMTVVASDGRTWIEFLFKGVGTRTKLDQPKGDFFQKFL